MKDKSYIQNLLFLVFLLLGLRVPLSVRAQVPEFWYEHKLRQLSLDQKIGQLFMVAAYSNKDDAHTAEIENLVSQYHIGGLIFFQNNPIRQAWLSNYYQSLASVPLMMGIDGEWGLSMRLLNTQKFPYAITLGALEKDSLVFEVGAAIARQCKRMGIHINFAPDIDINQNPANPIIGFRAFGDDKYRVARLGNAYSQGMLSENVLSCAKHFPGHGDVHTDSHLDLPVVDKSKKQLDSAELYPFRYLIREGVPSVMVAHIHFPQLDPRPGRPSSLSSYMIDSILRRDMGFDGLVFTDALNMKGVSKNYVPGHADLEAFLAGNDVLLFSENVPLAIGLIKEAVLSGRISVEELDRRVLRILKWKQFAGLHEYKPIDTRSLMKDLAGRENEELLQNVADACMGVPRDPAGLIPLKSSSGTLVLALGDDNASWSKSLQNKGIQHTYVMLGKDPSVQKRNSIVQKTNAYKTIIISLHKPQTWKQQKAGYTDADFELIRQIAARKKVIVIGFCNPYVLKYLPASVTVVAAYEDLPHYHRAAASLLSGQIQAEGVMPVRMDNPAASDPSAKDAILGEIDGIAAQLMMKKAAPGCRVLVIKDGKEVFNRSYGYLNYNVPDRVNDSTLYDIASVTKIAATTLAVMKLYEEGKLSLQASLGDYLPAARGSNKEKLIISDILQHRAGLTAWIPFYKETLPYIDSVFCADEDSNFCIKVADKLFMLKANKDTIYKRIFDSPLESREYRYSDLSMILMQLVVEQISGMGLDEFMDRHFYSPMGLRHITYNPWKKERKDNIAPTQLDRLFRQQELCGYVHDPAAAMLGGVSGHAGLFSNTGDLAALMLMLADSGYFRGRQYLSFKTIKTFTSYQRPDSRRGLGFDKPDFSGRVSPASTMGSTRMFGHTGFTGTCAWVDPDYGLVYVFLSNRICPIEENKELITGNYRTRIQDVIYRWIRSN